MVMPNEKNLINYKLLEDTIREFQAKGEIITVSIGGDNIVVQYVDKTPEDIVNEVKNFYNNNTFDNYITSVNGKKINRIEF